MRGYFQHQRFTWWNLKTTTPSGLRATRATSSVRQPDKDAPASAGATRTPATSARRRNRLTHTPPPSTPAIAGIGYSPTVARCSAKNFVLFGQMRNGPLANVAAERSRSTFHGRKRLATRDSRRRVLPRQVV